MRKRIFRDMGLVVAAMAILSGVITGGLCGGETFWTRVIQGFFIGVVVGTVGTLLSYLAAWRFVKPLSGGTEQELGAYQELQPVVRQMEEQRRSLRAGASALEQRDYGLRTVMENMTEGLVLLDTRGLIMSINGSASSLLGCTDKDYCGKHIFVANPSTMLQAVVYTALGGSSNEEVLELQGNKVQVLANPIRVEGTLQGVILFLFDVTEKQAAEQMRREFSANVSHELKTPLTSISGYAEIMKNGLVKSEDMGRFAGSIYEEAQRMIALVDDIIKLSRLDENREERLSEEVELLELARQVTRRLSDKAERYSVQVRVTGEPAVINGSAQLLEEMVYNLCDNAIKYNKAGGSVDVQVRPETERVVFTVRDTGIGIPREHQGRVFERFYRVDKSHSKETGGTGLGLSIVKHGAIYHNAQVELDSAADVGTTIRLIFGKNVS